MPKNISRKVIVDEPASEDKFHGKGHERTAISLARAIKNFNGEDRAIGLDGPWGSGKSSVVEIAARYLERDRSGENYHFFTFDIWKSQGTGFRRSFLEHFVSWSMEKFPGKKTALSKIESEIHGKTREIETNNHPVLGWFGIFVLIILPILPIYYFWAKSIYDKASKSGKAIEFLWSAPSWIFIVFAISIIIAANSKRKNSNKKMDFKTALSSVLLISSRQHQDHKIIQKIKEIDPNDYEFNQTIRRILGVIQTGNAKVVLVLDNIDRLPKSEIKEYWALVRSVFSRTHQGVAVDAGKTITAIVPYDRLLIEGNDSERNGAEGNSEVPPLTRLSSRELFSKTFDEVLVVAPPVLSNAREFFTEKLNLALPKQVSKDDGFRTYRIFCELIHEDGGTTTPRKVVSFVNDLSSLFVLHEGRYPLPTVAAYIAHQDLITSDPSKLNDISNLDYKIVKLASNTELQRHLAAIVFNVDADLAFQVLLDDVIASAMIADSSDDLERLSKASGFDLRVDDVVRNNLDEWHGAGNYKAVVSNFAEVLPSYKGDAKPHVISALVEGFDRVESFSIDENEVHSYMKLFKISGEEERITLLRKYTNLIFLGVESQELKDYSLGESFSNLLAYSSESLEVYNLVDDFKTELGRFVPNGNPEFAFGLAANIGDTEFDLAVFRDFEIELPEEGEYFEAIATKNPAEAILALEQFKKVNLLSSENWISVAGACLAACKTDNQEASRIADLLEVTCLSWRSLADEQRAQIPLAEVFSDGQFFRNLGSGASEASERAVANAFFLFGQIGLGKELNTPTKAQPNGQQNSDDSDEFASFKDIVQGTASLTDTQALDIAEKAKKAIKVANPWIKFGQDNPSHKAVSQIVVNVFSSGDAPKLQLSAFILYFDYLKELLGNELLVRALQNFGNGNVSDQIYKADLLRVPEGFIAITHQAGGPSWQLFHKQIDVKLQEISDSDWNKSVREVDHKSKLLIEKLSTSGCYLDSVKFRQPLVDLVLDILSGAENPPANGGALDILVTALDSSYRSDICRTVREKISDVSANSLHNAFHLFPGLLKDIVQNGERVMAVEKDNVIRHILCPALEGCNRSVLEIFVEMRYTRVADYIKYSNESTTQRLDGAIKSFSEVEKDRSWIRTVTEAIMGKRRTKSFWSTWFGD